jgi:MFS family permease
MRQTLTFHAVLRKSLTVLLLLCAAPPSQARTREQVIVASHPLAMQAGQAMLAASVIVIGLAEQSDVAVTVALVLLGLGWSAATVAGSALVSDLVTGATRVRVQGRTGLRVGSHDKAGAVRQALRKQEVDAGMA